MSVEAERAAAPAAPRKGLVAHEPCYDASARPPSVPVPPVGLSLGALATVLAVIAATFWAIAAVRRAMAAAAIESVLADALLYGFGALTLLLLLPATASVRAARRARAALPADLVAARVETAASRSAAGVAVGYAAAVLVVLGVAVFVIANDAAVAKTFVFLPLMRESFWLVFDAFWTNVYIFVIAEILVLIWGLVVAIARLIPGPAGQPIRLMATAYTDVFRGLPAIICIYLVGFGLPLTSLPLLGNWPPEWYAILALTLTYGAYVAEVYRAGIESVHPSQVAAARSLGLSFAQTLRFVVVPQAVRRIIPPLLNDFISLQKDTALVNVIGAIDAFNQAKIVASNHFNLSSVTTVAFLFVLITIPQARFVDRLIERDQRRTRAGSG
ncbi:amino acid ABC transporter permease [Benzoatithermus flavus]|uniref:Amino acid ABC transporter permease n=1 Tax=Benzoatithermus flavus TaxID=3108223 RepID=A0ABU8XP73_9PROT